MQDKALRRRTYLPRISEPCLHANFHRFLKIGIVQHDEHIVPAQFQRRFFNVLRRLCRHGAPRFFRSGQRRALHARVSDDVRHLIGGNKQVGPCAFRRAGFTHQMGKRLGAVRYDAGMFRQHRVTCGQVRRQHTHQLIVREVPRLNSHDDANRMMFYPRVAKLGFIRHRGKKLLRVIRIIASDLRTQFDFATALLDELAHLLAGDFCQFFNTAVDQVSQLMQYRQTLVNLSPGPVGVIERVSFLQRGFNIRVRVRGILFNELIIGRIHCLVSHITCLLVIVIKAAVNAAQNNKGSRDGWRYR